jgi:hypothetical protein
MLMGESGNGRESLAKAVKALRGDNEKSKGEN